jgi:hypothetical protein
MSHEHARAALIHEGISGYMPVAQQFLSHATLAGDSPPFRFYVIE